MINHNKENHNGCIMVIAKIVLTTTIVMTIALVITIVVVVVAKLEVKSNDSNRKKGEA